MLFNVTGPKPDRVEPSRSVDDVPKALIEAVQALAMAGRGSGMGEESGFSRAITFSNVPSMYDPIFGNKDALSINDWIEDGDEVFR